MAKKRKTKGMYYTPKHIVDYAKGVIDPAAGSGAFLKQAADLLRSLIKNPPYTKGK
jgi:type I restriction-modification system DNA methylase subunit